MTVLEQRTGQAISRARQIPGPEVASVEAICDTVSALGAYVTRDPVLACLYGPGVPLTGTERAHHQRRVTQQIATFVAERMRDQNASDLIMEASAGALWGMLESAVTWSPRYAPARTLESGAYLVLAPTMRASAADVACRSYTSATFGH